MSEPPVTIAAYHVTPGNNMPVGRIVIHTTSPPGVPFPVASAEGQARKTALYFTLASSGGSAQYVVDRAKEEHCLRDNQIAWHAPPNRYSIGIEICAQPFYTREQWLSGDVWPAVQRAKDRALELSQRHGVPWRRLTVDELARGGRGVCGHVDVSQAFHQTDHTDPGPNFPWDRFMAEESHITLGGAMARFPNAVDACWAPNGGVWVLGADGGVGAYGGASLPPAPFSYPGLPASERQGDRAFLRIVVSHIPGKSYDLLADDGSVYSF